MMKLAGVIAAALVLAGLLQAGKPINKKCPVKTDEAASPDFTATYQGKTLGFCCNDCKDSFEAKPADYAPKIPELKAAPAGQEPAGMVNEWCPVTYLHPNGMKGNPKYTIAINKKLVGFCCDGCRNKFIRAPDNYLKNLPEITGKALPPEEKKDEAKKDDLKKDDPKKDAKPEPTGPCDCKKTVKGFHCTMCKRDLVPDDMRSGLCKRCEVKPVGIEFCVKPGRLPADFKPGTPVPEDRSRVTYECAACGAKGDLETETKHAPTCKPLFGTGLKKVCTKSGTAPHATQEK
jgi:YHS domain-containing protein